MFRQKRKHRYEVASHVKDLTEGMTAKNLTEHLRFWRIIDKWGPSPNSNKDFLIAVDIRSCCFLVILNCAPAVDFTNLFRTTLFGS